MKVTNVRLVDDELEIETCMDGETVAGPASALLDSPAEHRAVSLYVAGAAYAMAQEVADNLDTFYRAWRANATAEFLAAGGKITHADKSIDAMPEFVERKRTIAGAVRMARTARALRDAVAALGGAS